MRDYAFGNRITSLRTELGLSQFQLGKLLGVSDKAVSKWENGNAKPRMATCYRLADVLGVSLDELLSSRNSEDARQKELEAVSMQLEEVQTTRTRLDAAMDKRIELHVRTGMSGVDGVALAAEYIQRAAEWGHSAIAVTDYGVTNGLPRAFKAAERQKIKLLPGCEGFMLPAADSPIESGYPIMLLATNRQGMTNLNRLMTLSHMQCQQSIPCMTREAVCAHREGLLIGCACDGGDVLSAVRAGAAEENLRQLISFYDYLEIQPIENEADHPEKQKELQQVVAQIVRLGEMTGTPVVAVSNARYLDPEDALSRAVLRYHVGILESDEQPSYYYRTTEEMLEAFRFLGEERARQVVIHAPRQIAARVEDGLTLFPPEQERYYPTLPGMQENVTETALRKARELYGDPLPEPVDTRLQEELHNIALQDSWINYEIARRVADFVHQEGYSVGARGTVGATLVAYLCGITNVDPLAPHYRCPRCRHAEFDVDHARYRVGLDLPEKICPACGCTMLGTGFDIPMETFFGLHGEQTADIDLNVASNQQLRVLDVVRDMFGGDHAIIPGHYYGHWSRKTGKYVQQYLTDHHLQIEPGEAQRIADNVSHMNVETGKHPGGLLIIPTDRDVDEFMPVQYLTDAWYGQCVITHYCEHDVIDQLLRVDLLPSDTQRLLHTLCEKTGIDLADVPLNDARVLSLFRSPEAMNVTARGTLCETGTCNLQDASSVSMQKLLQELQPRSVEELMRIQGLSRDTDTWEGNGQDYVRAGIIHWTECPAHRDDIFMDLIRGGLTKEEAYPIMRAVRLGKGKKQSVADGVRKAGLPAWYAEFCGKVRYLFPRAHAASYAISDLQLAWFKLYHPRAFYGAYLSNHREQVEVTDFRMDITRLRRAILSIRAEKVDDSEQFEFELEHDHLDRQRALETILEMRCRGIDPEEVWLEQVEER